MIHAIKQSIGIARHGIHEDLADMWCVLGACDPLGKERPGQRLDGGRNAKLREVGLHQERKAFLKRHFGDPADLKMEIPATLPLREFRVLSSRAWEKASMSTVWNG